MVLAAPSQSLNNGGFYLNTSVDSGSGNYDSFLRVLNSPTEDGFNTNIVNPTNPAPLNDLSGAFTHSIQIGELQVVHTDLGQGAGAQDYYEFRIDLNESNSAGSPPINLTAFSLFISGAPAVDGDYNGAGGFSDVLNPFTSVYSLSSPLALIDFSSGSGKDDGAIFIPKSLFDAAGATAASDLTLFANFTNTDGGFEEIRAVTNTVIGVSLNVEKLVSVDGGTNWYFQVVDGDTQDTAAYISGVTGIAIGDLHGYTTTPPTIFAGDTVKFEFVVQNTGTVSLNNVLLTDDTYNSDLAAAIGNLVTPGDLGTLAAGQVVTETITETSTSNSANTPNTDTATVTSDAVTTASGAVTPGDTDSVAYSGLAPSINVEKLVSVDGGVTWYFTSDDHSETAAGIAAAIAAAGGGAQTVIEGTPTAFSGESIQYEFLVQNTGNVALTNATLSDLPALAGLPTDLGTLAAGASVLSGPVAGTWSLGDNPDTATVTTDKVTDDGGHSVTPTDSDPADFTGIQASLNVEKLVSVDGGTNWYFQVASGDTQDTAAYISSVTGIAVGDLHIGTPNIIAGNQVEFEFVVQNTGNVALNNVTLTDDTYNADLAAAINNLVTPSDLGTLTAGQVVTETITETATSNGANTPIMDTATVGSDAVTDTAGTIVTPTDTDSVAYSGLNPSINVEKLVSVDGGTNWWFQQTAGDPQDTVAFVATASGISLANLHAYTTTPPTIAAGNTVQFEFVVTNTGNVALNGVTLGDNVYSLPATNITLAPGASQVIDPVSATALVGVQTDTVTASANTITDDGGHSITPTDTDSVAYNGLFIQSPAGLTIGYWHTHFPAATSAVLNPTALDGSALGQGVLLGDVNGNHHVDPGEDTLFVPYAAAVQLINSSTSANDTRQILISQALALQLNVDVLHTIDPGYAGSGPATGGDLLTEAVQWLRGESPFVFGDHSSGNVDFNGDHILNVGTTNGANLAGGFEYNTAKAAFTFEGIPQSAGGTVAAESGKVLTSNLNAWQTQELFHSADYIPTGAGTSAFSLTGGNFSADGEGLKNALQAVNQNHLVVSSNGALVAWDPSGSPTGPYTDVSLNGPNDFWKVLHDMAPTNSSLLHGIL